MHKIQRLTVTIDGIDHVWEGEGYVSVVRTKSGDGKEPVAHVQAHMPVEAGWKQGDGKYVSTPTVRL